MVFLSLTDDLRRKHKSCKCGSAWSANVAENGTCCKADAPRWAQALTGFSKSLFLSVIMVTTNRGCCDLILRYRNLLIVSVSTSRPGRYSSIERVPRLCSPHQIRHQTFRLSDMAGSTNTDPRAKWRPRWLLQVVGRPASVITPQHQHSNVPSCITKSRSLIYSGQHLESASAAPGHWAFIYFIQCLEICL